MNKREAKADLKEDKEQLFAELKVHVVDWKTGESYENYNPDQNL
jgi:hypothetical protein